MGAPVKIAAAVVVLAALLPASASAAYPASNGKIAFERSGQIWSMNANGTGAVQLTTDPAGASEPALSPDGQQILYTRGAGVGRRVWLMNADGTGNTQVPTSGDYAFSPTWSPDGTRMAYVWVSIASSGSPCTCHFHSVEEMNPDGTQRVFGLYGHFDGVNRFAAVITDVEWSPRGDALALTRQRESSSGARMLVVIGPNGNRFTRELPGAAFHVQSPAWSPDGERLAFAGFESDSGEVYTINPDGTGRQQLTNNLVPDSAVEWSPDGTKLVVSGSDRSCQDPPGPCPLELWLMNPNGASEQRLTTTPEHEFAPDWQPVIEAVPPPPGYPRPKGATPIYVSLVPAFKQCTAPNRTHGPPLAFASCNPPAQSSPYLTVGTPDANAAAANMVGSLRLEAMVGDPATAADEADIGITFRVTDVRCGPQIQPGLCPHANSTGGRDYLSGLRARLAVRVTDRYNLPAPGGRSPGTTAGHVPVQISPSCGMTPQDQTVGSTCTAQTTLEVFYPGAVKEGLRANYELAQVEIYDNGDDGHTGTGPPEQVFLRQGVFMP